MPLPTLTYQVMAPERRIYTLLFPSCRHFVENVHVLLVNGDNLEVILDAAGCHRLGQDHATTIDLVRD